MNSTKIYVKTQGAKGWSATVEELKDPRISGTGEHIYWVKFDRKGCSEFKRSTVREIVKKRRIL